MRIGESRVSVGGGVTQGGRKKWEGDRLLLLQYHERELIKKAVFLQDAAFLFYGLPVDFLNTLTS